MSRGGREEIESREREKEQTLVVSSSLMTLNVIYVPMTLKLIVHPWTLCWTPDLYIYSPTEHLHFIDISKLTHPKLNIWSSQRTDLPANSLHYSWWQLHPSNCSDQKSWSFSWLLLTHTLHIIVLSENPVESTFKIYMESDYFSPPQLLPVWLDLASSCPWRCPDLQTDLLFPSLP